VIRVVVKEPGKDAYERQITGTLASFQNVVGGYLEVVSHNMGEGMTVYANEDGYSLGLAPNIGPYVGTLVVCGLSPEGEDISLTDEQARLALAMTWGPR